MTDHFVEVHKKVLSPAAQAVLDAFKDQVELTWLTKDPEQVGLAAALRALADQLRLELPLGDTDADAGVFAAHHAITAAILAISTELGGQ